LVSLGFILYLFGRVFLSTGQSVQYGDLRRQPVFKQQRLPDNIIADFEYYFIPSNDPALPITQDSGTGKYDETKPKSTKLLKLVNEATPAGEPAKDDKSPYAGTGYTPSSNARLSPRDESPGAGRLLFGQSFRPKGVKAKAVIFFCHGFGDHTSWYIRDEAVMWAQRGFAVHTLDSYGNGRSDGLQNYIPSLPRLVDDYVHVIKEVRQRYPPDTKVFVVGHSMGGAIALHLAWRIPDIIKGLVLIAPMVKIVESLKPPKPVVQFLTFIASLWPTGPITPMPDVLYLCFAHEKVLHCRQQDPIRVKIKTRLISALEMVRVADDLETRLKDVTVPFIVVHGREDRVTAYEVSEALYKSASSTDKMIVHPPGALHDIFHCRGLNYAPTLKVFDQLAEWVLDRS